jgi:hypothetical protein
MTKRITRACGHNESMWVENEAQVTLFQQTECTKCHQDTKAHLYGID